MSKMEDNRLDLSPLDPETGDPGYWVRFHSRVLSEAERELARRRISAEWSVPEIVFQWRRTLVPLALLAATLAGLFLMEHEDSRATFAPVALEEALVEGLPGDPIPTVLERTAELDELAVLASSGGFRP